MTTGEFFFFFLKQNQKSGGPFFYVTGKTFRYFHPKSKLHCTRIVGFRRKNAVCERYRFHKSEYMSFARPLFSVNSSHKKILKNITTLGADFKQWMTMVTNAFGVIVRTFSKVPKINSSVKRVRRFK